MVGPITIEDLVEIKKFLDQTVPLKRCSIQHRIEIVDGIAYFLHPEGYPCASMPAEDLEAIFAMKETT